jgi:hypothetical protein
MSIADTARLIASLELEDKFSKTADKYNKALSGMERKTSTLDKVGFQVGRGARNVVDNVGRIAVVGAGLVASQVALGVRSLAQLEEAKNQTEAVITSTGGAAKVTAEQVRALAESLEDLTTVDDKAIQAGENMLLTFTNIRNEVGEGNDIFNQATKTLVDLSVAMGSDPKQAAIQLGKALNDPIKGITALTRVGVTFTEQQKDQIATMVEAGDTMGAQKVILAELTKEFGKSGEAFGKGPAADMRRFGDAIEGAQQALATGFLPVMQRVSKLVQETLADPQVKANITAFGQSLAGGVEDLIQIGSKLPWDAIGASAKLMGQGAKALLDAFTGLPPWVQQAVLTGWGLNKLTGGALGNIAGTLLGKGLGGLFGGRGGTPATPLFTKEVGLPGGGAGGGIGGLLTKLLGGAAIGAAIVGGIEASSSIQSAASRGQVDVGSAIDLVGFGAIGRAVSEALGIHNGVLIIGGTKPGAATPIGQFVPANQGGTPRQTGTPAGSGADNSITLAVKSMHKQIQAALQRGDIAEARELKEMVDTLRGLDSRSEKRNNLIIAGIGRTNSGLSTANRNLQDGNARQRELKAGIDQARSSLNTGFSRTNANLGVSNSRLSTIAAKDFSPNVNVSVNASTSVSISEVARSATTLSTATSLSSQTRHGFTA